MLLVDRIRQLPRRRSLTRRAGLHRRVVRARYRKKPPCMLPSPTSSELRPTSALSACGAPEATSAPATSLEQAHSEPSGRFR